MSVFARPFGNDSTSSRTNATSIVEVTGNIVRSGAAGLYRLPVGTYHLNATDPARQLLTRDDGSMVATFTDNEMRGLFAAKAMRPGKSRPL